MGPGSCLFPAVGLGRAYQAAPAALLPTPLKASQALTLLAFLRLGGWAIGKEGVLAWYCCLLLELTLSPPPLIGCSWQGGCAELLLLPCRGRHGAAGGQGQ